jgi:hypothetical protein
MPKEERQRQQFFSPSYEEDMWYESEIDMPGGDYRIGGRHGWMGCTIAQAGESVIELSS